MGHIELAAPVAHIWFLKSLPSRIGLLLDMALKDLERVLYFENYVVIEPGLTPLEERAASDAKRITSRRSGRVRRRHLHGRHRRGSGARTSDRRSISRRCASDLRQEIAEATTELKPKKLGKRLKVIEAFIRSGNRRNG